MTDLDFSLVMLKPSWRISTAGSSSVSSTQMILCFFMISSIIELSSDVLPLPLPPAISIALPPSTRKLLSPANSGSRYLPRMKSGKVHGFSLWRLNAYARPSGDSDFDIAATLALPPGVLISVSRTGLASSSGLPENSLNLVAHASASSLVGIRFVSHSSKS